MRLGVRLRGVCGGNMSGFALCPTTIRTDVSRIERRCGGLLFHRERGRRRELLRLRRLFEGTHPDLWLRRGFKRIRSGHLRRSLETEALRFRDLERSFGWLATLRQAYRFRIFLWLIYANQREGGFPAGLRGIRGSKRAFRRTLRRDREWRCLGGTGSSGGRGWGLVGFENSSWCAHTF